MTELFILLSLIPFVFVVFGGPKRMQVLVGFICVLMALAANAFFIFLHRNEPFWWIPVGAFLCMFVVGSLSQKEFRSLSALGVLFISQALLTRETGEIIILLAFADALFSVEMFLSSDIEEKNIAVQSVYQSAWSFLPAATGVLLHLHGDLLTACVAVTIVLRLFSWPVNHWVYEINQNNRLFMVFLGGVSSFALWHVQALGETVPWPLVWLGIATLFSFGAKYLELYGVLALALYSLSPVLGILAMTLWPLLTHQGKLTYLVALVLASAGVLISESSQGILLEQASYPLAALAGIAIGRVAASTETLSVKWYWELVDVVVAAGWTAVCVWYSPPQFKIITGPGIAFGAAFALIFIVGKALLAKRASKKPLFFLPAPSLSPRVFSRDFMTLGFLSEKSGGPVKILPTRAQNYLFAALESEAHIAVLLGLLGAVLLWRFR